MMGNGELHQANQDPRSNQIFALFHPNLSEVKNYVQDSPHFRQTVAWSYVLTYATTLASFSLIHLLPNQKLDAHHRKRSWSTRASYGLLVLALPGIGCCYSLVLLVLTNITSTSLDVLRPGPRESGHAVPTVPDQSEAQHWAQCTAPGSNEVQCTGLEVQGDGHGIGALYMLRTQLAKERKEKEMWREKAQEVEQLRTRLAIWTEKPDAPPDRLAAVTLSAAEGSAATPRERGAVSGDFRRSEAPEERGESQRAETKLQLKDPGTRSSRISSSSSTAEE
eukprot:g26862.t1